MVGQAGSRGVFAGGTLAGSLGSAAGQAFGGAAAQAFGYPGASGQAPTIAANDPPPASSAPAAPAASPATAADPSQMVTKLVSSAGGMLNGLAKRFPWWMWLLAGSVFSFFIFRKGWLKKAASAIG